MENLSEFNELKLALLNRRIYEPLSDLFKHQLYRNTGTECKNSKECLRELHALISRNRENFQTLKIEYQQNLLKQEGALDTPVLCSLLNLPCFDIENENGASIKRAVRILKSFRGVWAHLGDRVQDFMDGKLSNKRTDVFFECDFEAVFEKLYDSVQCIYGYLKKERSVVIDNNKIDEFLKEFIKLKDCHFVARGESKLKLKISFYVEKKSRKDITRSQKITIDNVGKHLVDHFPQIIESFYGGCYVQSVTTPEQKTGIKKYFYYVNIEVFPGRNSLLCSAKHLLDLTNRYSNEAIALRKHITREVPDSIQKKHNIIKILIAGFEHWEIIC